MDLRHDVPAVDSDVSAGRRAERHVEHGAILGHIDFVAAEHALAPFLDARLAREG